MRPLVRSLAFAAATVFTAVVASCDDPPLQPTSDEACFNTINQCLRGTVRYHAVEAGFWAIRGDDSVTYDPVNGLPSDFRLDGLRVNLVLKPRTDLVGFHQVGPIVEVLAISRIP